MDGAQKKEITLRRATVAEVAPLIALAAQYNNDDEPFDPEKVAANGARFVFEEAGQAVCGFVIEARESEAFIMAAGAVGRYDFTRIGLGAIEGMARKEFETVAFSTRRGGLIRKARRLGYVVDGTCGDGLVLRKRIK